MKTVSTLANSLLNNVCDCYFEGKELISDSLSTNTSMMHIDKVNKENKAANEENRSSQACIVSRGKGERRRRGVSFYKCQPGWSLAACSDGRLVNTTAENIQVIRLFLTSPNCGRDSQGWPSWWWVVEMEEEEEGDLSPLLK